jgi:hypothetical protein
VTVDGDTLASIVHDGESASTQIASNAATSCELQVIRVAGRPVRSFEHLHAIVEGAVDSSETVQVAIANSNADAMPVAWAQTSDVPESAVRPDSGSVAKTIALTPTSLRALEHGVARSEKTIRVFEDGNPWIVIREANVRSKLTARVERTSGLMQVVMTLELLAGPPVLLPVEVTATCQGMPLQCLTVAEALETLYGRVPPDERVKSSNDSSLIDHRSFAVVSQRDEYLVPTNYKRLQEETKRAAGLPAFAVVSGTSYPGSPLLGDARALAQFALQPQLCQPGEPERIGWIIFSGEALKQGGRIQIDVDLGHGPIPIAFLVPKP